LLISVKDHKTAEMSDNFMGCFR